MAKTEPHVLCACGKRAFADERSGERALGRARAKRNRQVSTNGSRRGLHIEQRVYLCEWSNLLHLTSMSRRLYEEQSWVA